jgi:hydroxyacylglutathione hydrolase
LGYKSLEMIKIQSFCFNPFQENTYILYDETGDCVIIDPGCYNTAEQNVLVSFLETNKLKPVRLLNTHGHIDHVFGNKFIHDKYKLGLEIHEKDLTTLHSMMQVAHLYQLQAEASPEPASFLKEGTQVVFGNSLLDIVFTPGHSPGSVCFISAKDKLVIGGDVLFRESIGRTDLPGGNHQTLLESIQKQLFVLPDDYQVFPGHGSATTIGHEKQHNPFMN